MVKATPSVHDPLLLSRQQLLKSTCNRGWGVYQDGRAADLDVHVVQAGAQRVARHLQPTSSNNS